MKSKEIPSELLPAVGKLIRQGRTARGLTIEQAAETVGLPVNDLQNLEEGSTSATSDHLMFILAKYGGVRADAAEGMLIRLMMEESRCRTHTEKRKHLSLAGEVDARPWEKVRYNDVTRGIY